MGILQQFSLEGKTALVTGCRRGIGRAYAQALAEAGADIIGVSASQEASGSPVEKDVIERGRAFKGYACDFSDRQALHRFIDQVKGDYTRTRDYSQIALLMSKYWYGCYGHRPPMPVGPGWYNLRGRDDLRDRQFRYVFLPGALF